VGRIVFTQLRERLFGASQSKAVAKSRLHFVLVQDRSGLSNDEMARFKKELVGVIKKFFFIEDTGIEIDYQRDQDSTTLVINSPVLRRRLGAKANGSPAPDGNPAPDTEEDAPIAHGA